MPEAKRLQELAGGSELLHERDGHKWGGRKDCRDGKNGNENSTRKKPRVREMLNSTELETILRYKMASEGRG